MIPCAVLPGSVTTHWAPAVMQCSDIPVKKKKIESNLMIFLLCSDSYFVTSPKFRLIVRVREMV